MIGDEYYKQDFPGKAAQLQHEIRTWIIQANDSTRQYSTVLKGYHYHNEVAQGRLV